MLQYTLIKYAVAAAGALAMILAAYSWAYNRGRTQAEQAALLREQQAQIETYQHLDRLYQRLGSISHTLTQAERKHQQDYQQLLATARKSPQIIIQDGTCVPTQEFIQNLNRAITP